MNDIYVFECTTDSSIHGFTKVKDGSNLPTGENCKSWKSKKNISVSELTPPLIAVDNKAMLESIEKEGYYIGGYTMTFTEKILSPSENPV